MIILLFLLIIPHRMTLLHQCIPSGGEREMLLEMGGEMMRLKDVVKSVPTRKGVVVTRKYSHCEFKRCCNFP